MIYHNINNNHTNNSNNITTILIIIVISVHMYRYVYAKTRCWTTDEGT